MKLQCGEDAIVQIVEMAIDVYEKENCSAATAAKLVIEATKEMIARGQIRNGIVIGSEEK